MRTIFSWLVMIAAWVILTPVYIVGSVWMLCTGKRIKFDR
jgi:hypothetical protein